MANNNSATIPGANAKAGRPTVVGKSKNTRKRKRRTTTTKKK